VRQLRAFRAEQRNKIYRVIGIFVIGSRAVLTSALVLTGVLAISESGLAAQKGKTLSLFGMYPIFLLGQSD
jgi:hypothetical protein